MVTAHPGTATEHDGYLAQSVPSAHSCSSPYHPLSTDTDSAAASSMLKHTLAKSHSLQHNLFRAVMQSFVTPLSAALPAQRSVLAHASTLLGALHKAEHSLRTSARHPRTSTSSLKRARMVRGTSSSSAAGAVHAGAAACLRPPLPHTTTATRLRERQRVYGATPSLAGTTWHRTTCPPSEQAPVKLSSAAWLPSGSCACMHAGGYEQVLDASAAASLAHHGHLTTRSLFDLVQFCSVLFNLALVSCSGIRHTGDRGAGGPGVARGVKQVHSSAAASAAATPIEVHRLFTASPGHLPASIPVACRHDCLLGLRQEQGCKLARTNLDVLGSVCS